MDIQTKPKSGPRDFFIHLLGFGTLYASAVSLISLWFQYINIKLPDPLNQYYSYGYEQLRVPMAVLFVVFPVFLFLSRWMNSKIAEDPARKELRIYKWLVYFTLFVSAVTVIIDLITLIYNFLGGELTARFGLKVLVVLIVALGVFGYYLWNLRADLAMARSKRKALFWGAIVAIVGSIIAGFVIVGSPTTARALRFDERRVQDLQSIQWQITDYWQRTEKLPTALSVLENELAGYTNPMDPETQVLYEYRVVNPLTFELCAVFTTEGTWPSREKYPAVVRVPEQSNWSHEVGRACFERTIDPTLYPKPLR
ncbi:MAG: DUF5671 domain-containing protein [Patescibacteria group bacterium]